MLIIVRMEGFVSEFVQSEFCDRSHFVVMTQPDLSVLQQVSKTAEII